MPEDSPYNPELAGRSEKASSLLLEEVVKATGAKDRGNRKNNSYTGINWSEVPVVILETGFMTNPEEDLLMATTSYRERLAQGIARAIVRYVGE
jgi:N-acetylmuramoyl-L-alanine amidase